MPEIQNETVFTQTRFCPYCGSHLLMGVMGDLSLAACGKCHGRFPRNIELFLKDVKTERDEANRIADAAFKEAERYHQLALLADPTLREIETAALAASAEPQKFTLGTTAQSTWPETETGKDNSMEETGQPTTAKTDEEGNLIDEEMPEREPESETGIIGATSKWATDAGTVKFPPREPESETA